MKEDPLFKWVVNDMDRFWSREWALRWRLVVSVFKGCIQQGVRFSRMIHYFVIWSSSVRTAFLYSGSPSFREYTRLPCRSDAWVCPIRVHTQTSLHTVSIRRSSWETKMTPPWNWCRASANAEIVSTSRWFVGSSRTSRLGLKCKKDISIILLCWEVGDIN